MKRLLIILAIFVAACCGINAQTATNFISTDCQGNTHNLFTELDTGRVVVITWVMPCGGCVAPATTAYGLANSYGQQWPGRVAFYLCDDYGNYSCSNITAWAVSSGIHSVTFSDSNIRMSDYGPYGMPKTVVLGGSNHHVYYMYDAGQDTAAFTAAIDSALAATAIPVAGSFQQVDPIYPNPADDHADVSFAMTEAGDVTIEIFDLSGHLIRHLDTPDHYVGVFRQRIDCGDLAEGAYLVKVTSGDKHAEQLLTIKHR